MCVRVYIYIHTYIHTYTRRLDANEILEGFTRMGIPITAQEAREIVEEADVVIYICVCVCVCIYIYIYTHTHIYTSRSSGDSRGS